MEYKINKDNNSKKLIIGVSILFCTIILIIGTTLAFFTQSDSGTTGNIVSENINGTIGYTDNKDYMRNNLIPVIETDVVKFAMKNSLNNFTDNDICKYNDEYNACSLYEFTITNNADVTQELLVSMSPTLNQYGNLYFIVFEGNRTSLTTNSKIVHNSTHIKQDTINFNDLDLILKPKESKTYTIVFYIKSLNIDQTIVDSGKAYAATINVNSVTTGDYLSINVGEGCYDSVRLDDGTYKLTKFKGIDVENDKPIEGCGVTKDEDGFYSVIIPSEFGGQEISTLGNILFFPTDLETFDPSDLSSIKMNKNTYIKEFTINEGITTVEDGFKLNAGSLGDLNIGTFTVAGYDYFSKQPVVEEGVRFNLPSSLKYIGNDGFNSGYIKEIDLPNNLEYIGERAFYNIKTLTEISIPSTVKTIGKRAFYNNENLETLTFEGAIEGISQLTTIGGSAFQNCDIKSLNIPSSVTTIGDNAFYGLVHGASGNGMRETDLEIINFLGSNDNTSKLTSIGNAAFYGAIIKELIIPKNVEIIGDEAFKWTKLNSIEFVGYNNGSSQLTTIGDSAFYSAELTKLDLPDGLENIGASAFEKNILTYTDPLNPLVIPDSVTAIGSNAFATVPNSSYSNADLKYIRFNGTLTAGNTDWYDSTNTILNP